MKNILIFLKKYVIYQLQLRYDECITNLLKFLIKRVDLLWKGEHYLDDLIMESCL